MSAFLMYRFAASAIVVIAFTLVGVGQQASPGASIQSEIARVPTDRRDRT